MDEYPGESAEARYDRFDAEYSISRAMSIIAKAAMLSIKAERVRDRITPEAERDQNNHLVASLGVLGGLCTLGTFYRPTVNKIRHLHADYLEMRADRQRDLVGRYDPTT